jgi:osmotically-inducible protein OsmY
LTEAGDVDATDIEVKVVAGVVTLSGSVTSRIAKRRAEDLAEGVRGVNDVQNQLCIQPNGKR